MSNLAGSSAISSASANASRNFWDLRGSLPPPLKIAGPTAEEAAEAARRAQEAAEPAPATPKPKPKPAQPKAPPIKWKYYGFANSATDARKRAFLLGEEEEVFVATEGDIFKKRYRIVRIGINSIVIEDMQFKDEQTLPLQES